MQIFDICTTLGRCMDALMVLEMRAYHAPAKQGSAHIAQLKALIAEANAWLDAVLDVIGKMRTPQIAAGEVSAFTDIEYEKNKLYTSLSALKLEHQTDSADYKIKLAHYRFLEEKMSELAVLNTRASTLLTTLGDDQKLQAFSAARYAVSELFANDRNLVAHCHSVHPVALQAVAKRALAKPAEGVTTRVYYGLGWLGRSINVTDENAALDALYAQAKQAEFDPNRAIEYLMNIGPAFLVTAGQARKYAGNIYSMLPLLADKFASDVFKRNVESCQLAALSFGQLLAVINKARRLSDLTDCERESIEKATLVLNILVKRITDYKEMMGSLKKRFTPLCYDGSDNLQVLIQLHTDVCTLVTQANERKRLEDCANVYRQACQAIEAVEYKVIPGYMMVRGDTITQQYELCLTMAEQLEGYARDFDKPCTDSAAFYAECLIQAKANNPKWNDNLRTKEALAVHTFIVKTLMPELSASHQSAGAEMAGGGGGAAAAAHVSEPTPATPGVAAAAAAAYAASLPPPPPPLTGGAVDAPTPTLPPPPPAL